MLSSLLNQCILYAYNLLTLFINFIMFYLFIDFIYYFYLLFLSIIFIHYALLFCWLVVGTAPTCGLTLLEEVFCTYNGVTHVGPRPTLEAPDTPILGTFFNSLMNTDPLNPCNCAPFFAAPNRALPANCAMAPHGKTIMLNADMVQAFPITAQSGQNNVLNTPALEIGLGVDVELCGKKVTDLSSQIAPRPPRLNTNQRVNNNNLVFPEAVFSATETISAQGFGCVSNTIGDGPSLGPRATLNKQTLHSSLLPKDPTNTAVSLWETVQSFMTLSLGGCLEGISTFNGHFAPYGGSVKIPLPAGSYIGNNAIGTQCTDPTPQFLNGRDNFYREFEIAFTKMSTVGYTYSHTFNPPTVTSYTDLTGQAEVPPLPAVINNAINGISVFIDPATGTAKSINMVASGDGKLGRLFDANLGSSSCTTDYPTPCYSAPSVKPTKAPISKKPTGKPVTKRPTRAPV